jgi:N-acetylgalactosamine-6-sulfatase
VRIAGAKIPPGRDFDGIDILKLVETGESPQKRTLFWRGRRGQRTRKAVRDGDMKYIWQSDGKKFEEYLFDLKSDVGENRDLLKERPRETARLRALLATWEREVRHTR